MSRLKYEQTVVAPTGRAVHQSAPLIDELLDDYFAAEVALKAEGKPVLFRGQPVTRGVLITRLREEAVRCGIDEDEMGVAFTQRWCGYSN